MDEDKVRSLGERLSHMQVANRDYQHQFQVLLEDHSSLLDEFKTLKNAYEQKGPQNGDKKTAAQADYALVLVDGNGYFFTDDLIKGKEEGGKKAACLLNEEVEKYLRGINKSVSRVAVRIYADLTTLSKTLGRLKLAGLEKRSFASFAAGFSRAVNSFDFVDTLDEEGTMSKIGAFFRLAIEDDACTHILYAACRDPRYLADITPYDGFKNKISIVQGAGFDEEFFKLDLPVARFPSIFRLDDLSSNPSSNQYTANPPDPLVHSPLKPQKAFALSNRNWRDNAPGGEGAEKAERVSSPLKFGSGTNGRGAGADPDTIRKYQKLCRNFVKGDCRFGKSCMYLHETNNNESTNRNNESMDRPNISSLLPKQPPAPGAIYLNKDGQRIDAYVRRPTPEEWETYHEKFQYKKPCNYFHLRGYCTSLKCNFDHRVLEPEARHVLEFQMRGRMCSAGHDCKDPTCLYGHLCQKDRCTGKLKECKMGPTFHDVDPRPATTVSRPVRTCHNCGSVDHIIAHCKADPGMCRHCGMPGHFSRDCPDPKDDWEVECSYCGEKGHTIKLCPQPISDDDASGEEASEDDGPSWK